MGPVSFSRSRFAAVAQPTHSRRFSLSLPRAFLLPPPPLRSFSAPSLARVRSLARSSEPVKREELSPSHQGAIFDAGKRKERHEREKRREEGNATDADDDDDDDRRHRCLVAIFHPFLRLPRLRGGRGLPPSFHSPSSFSMARVVVVPSPPRLSISTPTVGHRMCESRKGKHGPRTVSTGESTLEAPPPPMLPSLTAPFLARSTSTRPQPRPIFVSTPIAPLLL